MVKVEPEVKLLSPATIRELADRLGVRPSKRLGQNFVTDQGTVRRIASLAGLRPDDVVLEVGPGLGSLTLALLESGAGRVVAVEIDQVLAAELPRTLARRAPGLADRVVVVAGDALSVGEPYRPAATAVAEPAARQSDSPVAPTVLVANLPYNVAVPVVLHLLAALPSLARGLVMVQAEVADRMCAAPGSRVYGAPSVKLAWYATARPAGTVPRSVFWPVPNVDSRLVAFARHDPPVTAASREQVFALIDAAFGQRRKTLRAALASWAGSAQQREGHVAAHRGGNPAELSPDQCLAVTGFSPAPVHWWFTSSGAPPARSDRPGSFCRPAPEAERLLRAAGIDPRARGESLSVAEFARLATGRVPSHHLDYSPP